MSDHHSREQLYVATTTSSASTKKNLSSSSAAKQEQPLANDQLQRTDHKLLSSSKYLSIELNNNSIFQQPSSTADQLFRAETYSKLMDQSNKSSYQQSNKRADVKQASALAAGSPGGNNQTPSYSSIFTSPSYNRSSSPAQEIQQLHLNKQERPNKAPSDARRGSRLKKQDATKADIDLEIPTLSLEKTLSQKKLSNFEFADGDDDDVRRAGERPDDDDNDEENDDLGDYGSQNNNDSDDLSNHEKQPFRSSTSLAKLKLTKGRKNPSSNNHHHHHHHHSRCQLTAANEKNKSPRSAELNASHPNKSPYTKISFSESRPPSFGTCQAAFNHYLYHNEAGSDCGAAKLQNDWQLCARCDCSKCAEKLKVNAIGCNSAIQMDPYAKAYNRTKSIHLVLKSIILVLLTILLLMMFIGIIMATHYLPSLFDKVLNVSRSFNVTIAGR